MSEGKQSFVRGAVILGAAGIFVKVLGATFKLPLGNFLGDEGMSYYTTAYPIYSWLIVASTAGMPTAIARMISERRAVGDEKGINKIFRTSMLLMMFVGVILSVGMFLSAQTMVSAVKNEMAYYSVLAIAPAIFFVSVMSVMRGYFQGLQMMEPYAISQIAEQLMRVILGLTLALTLLDRGLEFASAGATFGATAGAMMGTLVIIFIYRRFKRKTNMTHEVSDESMGSIVKQLMIIAIPVTIGASVLPLMNSIDLAIVIRRLHSIGIVEEANNLYGQLTGYAVTLVNLPQVVSAAIQISIVPAIAQLRIKNDQKGLDSTTVTGIKLALLIGLPTAVGMVILAEPIIALLYPMQPGIIKSTGGILRILGNGVVFLSLFQVTTGILQGLGKQHLPARNLFIGAIVKLTLSYTLVGIPAININGAAISTVCGFATAAILNMITLVRRSTTKMDYKEIFGKPILNVLTMSVFVLSSRQLFLLLGSGRLATVLSILVGIVVYFVMVFLTNTLSENDLELMPGGSKLKKLNRILTIKAGDKK